MMGGKKRNARLTRQLTIDDPEVVDAIKECDTARLILTVGLNVFNKCGNCPWRFKCGVDLVDVANRKYNFIPSGSDISESKLAKVGLAGMNYVLEHLSQDEKLELMDVMLEEAGMEADDILMLVDDIFGLCNVYNKIKIDADEDKITLKHEHQ